MTIEEYRISNQQIQKGRLYFWIRVAALIILMSLTSAIAVTEARQITLTEDFEDQDLTQNPAWNGDLEDFRFTQENDNHLLQLDSEEAGHSIIYTESITAFGAWEFYYRPEVGPSNNNRTFFVLMSDSDDLNFIGGGSTSQMNGYAVRAGDNTGHRAFKLGRVDNGDFQSSIITETETVITEGIGYQVRVERNLDGDWQIFVSEGYGSTPVADSPVVNDDTYVSSNFFGLLVIYSGANRDKFYYDDILIHEPSDGSDTDGTDESDGSDPDGSDGDEDSSSDDSNGDDDSGSDDSEGDEDTGSDDSEGDGDSGSDDSDDDGDSGSDDSDGDEDSGSDDSDGDEDSGSDDSEGDGDSGSDDSEGDGDSGSDDSDGDGDSGSDETEHDPVEEPEELNVLDIEVISAIQLKIFFDQPLEESTVVPDHFNVDQDVGQPATATIESDQNVILGFGEPFRDGEYLLTIYGIESQDNGTLSSESEFQFTVQNPFYLFDVRQSGSNGIVLEFSTDVDIQSVSTDDIMLSGTGNPDEIVLLDSQVLQVLFGSNLQAGDYDITVVNMRSADGWEIEPGTTFSLTVFDLFEPGDLVVSEFYYRVPVSWRTQTYDRPQYIELYNSSDKRLNLRDAQISGHNISIGRDLPIDPDEYLVITRGRPVFVDRFGERNFVEADEFPRLNLTTSDRIHLVTADGETIEDLKYIASEWGGNSVSLERLSFYLDAALRGNWAESLDALTGSPGLPNTVSIPSGLPVALSVETPEPKLVMVLFSREIEHNSVSDLENFSLGSETDIQSADVDESGSYLIIQTASPLIDGNQYTFSYTGIMDLFGNRVNEERQIEFTFVNPFRVSDIRLADSGILRITFTMPFEFNSVEPARFTLTDGTTPVQSEIINSTTIELTFSDPFEFGSHRLKIQDIKSFDPDLNEQWKIESDTEIQFYRFEEIQSGDLLLNEFMVRPPPGVPRYVEIFNRSNRFLNLKNYELRRRPGSTNNGGILSASDLPIKPGGYLVITEDQTLLAESFGDGPWFEMSGYPGFTQTATDQIRFINPEGVVIQEVEYNPPEWGGNGFSLERRSIDAPVNHIFNWLPSVDERKGTPGLVNSVTADDSGPFLDGVHLLDEQTLSLSFGGAVYLDVVNTSDFQISGGVQVENLDIQNWNTVLINLSTPLSSGQTYTLTTRNITDIFGNSMDTAQSTFTYYRVESAAPGDVVINEFMYNEPDDYSRYIELYNRSHKVFDLAGWQQANNTGTRRTLINETVLFHPGAYLVIAPNDDLLQLFPGIPLLNVGTRLSALKNGGDSIVILNESGVVLDSLSYTPDWGGNGVALERRRADLPAIHRENWGESPSMLLGTPGTRNEVESRFVLQVNTIVAKNREIVELHFNAPVLESSILPGHFRVGDHHPNDAVLIGPALIELNFHEPLPSGQHQMQIHSLETPAGFSVDTDTSYLFTVYDEYAKGDVILNEFMIRPPPGYPRYVELLNVSDKLLNLQNWRLQRRQNATGSNGLITDENPLEPGEYLVLTEDSSQIREIFGEVNHLELVNFPGFTVSVPDQIRIQAADGSTADSLEYIPALWGGDGVSLERLSSAAPTYLFENWAESKDPRLGTPGAPNSVEPDKEPPQLLSVHQNSNSGFILRFDKRPDRSSALDLSNYLFEPHLELDIAIQEGKIVRLNIKSDMVNNQIYDLTVKNIRDIFGNEMEAVTVSLRYLELSESFFKEIVINEILYRREQSGSPQFIEVYNRSENNFDMSGWALANNSGSMTLPDGLLIPAESYKVFTDSELPQSGSEEIVVLPNFRAFSSSGDQVVLKNREGVLIDSLYYKHEWRENPPGVSLERRDPKALSIDPHNWVLSVSVTGSTPGEQNSRFEPDEAPPEIIFVNFFHPDSIEVVFDKYVNLQESESEIIGKRNSIVWPASADEEPLPQPRFLVNGIEVSVVKYDPSAGNRVVLDGSGISRSDKVSIAVDNLSDFQGNELSIWDGLVALPAEPGDLVFNEIMYQPIADNRDGLPDQSEYLEFVNTRPYPISLEGMFLHDEPDENGNIVKMFPVSTIHRSIPADGFLLIYPENSASRFIDSRTARFFDLAEEDEIEELTALRVDRNTLSLPNGGRAIYLADSTHRVIDRVQYSPDWHNPNLIDTRGISLERISTTLDTDSPDNWSSSANTLGGTPGSANSLFQHPGARNEKVGIKVEPNPFSPDGDGFEDHLFIHYKLDEPDYLIRIRIFDRYGRLVRNLVNGEAAGFDGTRIWDGRMDNGQNNRIGIYIILFDAFDSANGRNLQFREPVVIARRF